MTHHSPYHKKDPYAEREALRYDDPIPSREFIMEYLDELGHPTNQEGLLEAFELTKPSAIEAMRRRLIAMVRDGQLIKNRRGKYALVKNLELVCGRVSAHREGFGLLFPDEEGPTVFLPYRQMRQLFHGDRVLVQLVGAGRRGRQEGVVVEIVERVCKEVIGRFYQENGINFVVPDGKQSNQEVDIPPSKTADAVHGQFVKASIVSYPDKRHRAVGEIVEILGDETYPGLEIKLALQANNLPHEWSAELLAEIRDLKPTIAEQDKLQRKDLRDLPLVTIDGIDAKDFDDAVYCEPHEKGGWRLWVAIADVSHYVKQNTALNREAYDRGNSVYFPHNVIPMLPEILSNQLCSLKPKVDRLCIVCEMDVTKNGKLSRYQFYRAVMHSKARLTYTEVADALASDDTSVTNKKILSVLPHLRNLHTLYQALLKARQQRGAIEFDTVETRMVFDSVGKIKTILPVVRNDAHRLIEECMLLANLATVQFLNRHKLPILYRVHEGFNESKLANLQTFLKEMGLQLGGGDNPGPKDYVKLLQHVEGRPDAELIQTVLLRSMKQAVYTPESDPHFGLAFDKYCHFTSPIRRYPDLIVHRAIAHLLDGGNAQNFIYTKETLEKYGQHCSMTERRADDAVRDAVSWLKCEYMLNKLGEKFDGIVTHVTSFGVFVMLRDIYVEGLLHITGLRSDYYHYDAIHHRLVGKRSGTTYRLGDRLQVLVARVNIDERQIDFELEE